MPKNKRIFTNEEKKFIKDNYGEMTIWALRNHFKCSWYAVEGVVKELGLELPESDAWTEEEIKKLREYAEDCYDQREIAELLGRTETAVYRKARRLGIAIKQVGGRMWTPEEERDFRTLWGTVRIDKLAKQFRRTINSLKVKAQRMDLPPMIENNIDLSIKQFCELVGVSRDRVARWQKLGLRVTRKEVTRKKKYKYIKLENALKFMKNHQDEFDASRIDYLALGLEPKWLQEKRKRDSQEKVHLKEYVNRRFWTKEEKDLLKAYIQAGICYIEISERLHRSLYSIGHKVSELGLAYRGRRFWSGKELKYIKDNYKSMTHVAMGKMIGRTEKAVSEQCRKYGYLKKES